MKGLLLFIAGVLLGANVVYFAMRAHPPASPAVVAATQAAQGIRARASATGAGASAAASSRATSATSATSAASASSTAAPAPAPASASAMAPLLLPVRGVLPSQLRSTFADTRGGGTRPHEALDIMAPRGTPVLAAVDGTVEKLFASVPGGLTIYEFDRARTRAYYYAHLDRYADGLAEGRALRRGDVIGYVGSTGNAAEDAPHLHFAIFVLGPEKHWWEGTAIDPYPLLANAAAH